MCVEVCQNPTFFSSFGQNWFCVYEQLLLLFFSCFFQFLVKSDPFLWMNLSIHSPLFSFLSTCLKATICSSSDLKNPTGRWRNTWGNSTFLHLYKLSYVSIIVSQPEKGGPVLFVSLRKTKVKTVSFLDEEKWYWKHEGKVSWGNH